MNGRDPPRRTAHSHFTRAAGDKGEGTFANLQRSVGVVDRRRAGGRLTRRRRRQPFIFLVLLWWTPPENTNVKTIQRSHLSYPTVRRIHPRARRRRRDARASTSEAALNRRLFVSVIAVSFRNGTLARRVIFSRDVIQRATAGDASGSAGD